MCRYAGMSNREVVKAVCYNHEICMFVEGMSEELYEIMKMCWRFNRDMRPTFRQLMARLRQLTGAPPSVKLNVSLLEHIDPTDDSESDSDHNEHNV